MDSHGPRLDGIRVRGGSLWALPAATPDYRTYFSGTVVPAVAAVRHRADRGWGSRECFRRMAPPPVGPGIGSRPDGTSSFFDPSSRDRFLSGLSRTGDGDLSGFGPKYRSLGLLCLKYMIGHLERRVGRGLRRKFQDKGIVIREIVTPAVGIVDASAIVTWYCALVVSEEAAPYVHFRLCLAAILAGENAAVWDADQCERVRVGSAIAKAGRLRHNSDGGEKVLEKFVAYF